MLSCSHLTHTHVHCLLDQPLREEYEKEFAEYVELSCLASQSRPAKRTKTSAIASGNRVLSGSSEKTEAYRDVDLYTVNLWYHDKIKHTLYDSAHEFANTIKQILIFICNKAGKKSNFKDSRRDYEMDVLGRFPNLAPNADRKRPPLPWVAPPKNVAEIDSLVHTLRVPSNWPNVRKIFTDCLRMKTAELLLLAGDTGAYFLRLMDIDAEYKNLFIELLHLLEKSSPHPPSPAPRAYDRKPTTTMFCMAYYIFWMTYTITLLIQIWYGVHYVLYAIHLHGIPYSIFCMSNTTTLHDTEMAAIQDLLNTCCLHAGACTRPVRLEIVPQFARVFRKC